MGFVIGSVLALAVGIFATRVGLDRGRTFYATVTIVIASLHWKSRGRVRPQTA